VRSPLLVSFPSFDTFTRLKPSLLLEKAVPFPKIHPFRQQVSAITQTPSCLRQNVLPPLSSPFLRASAPYSTENLASLRSDANASCAGMNFTQAKENLYAVTT